MIFLAVSGERVNPLPETPSWPEKEVLLFNTELKAQ